MQISDDHSAQLFTERQLDDYLHTTIAIVIRYNRRMTNIRHFKPTNCSGWACP